MVAINIEMPKNCVECDRKGIRNNCRLIFDGCANCGRHPNCPLVEIEERKVGKWICVHHLENKITYDSWKCSECQHDFNSEEESMVDFDEYKFCPNCGADMRGSENV